ncbi:MAG: DUF123 domain-containing protein [Alphaproteobacteria bacterium]|nr:DUF123 domain-containing protein [Alphaproteobacteria bacterium]
MNVIPVVDALDLPDGPGAYLLAVEVVRPMSLEIAGRWWDVPEGRYLYAGSAKGPGGIRARAGHHRAAAKVVHWHIDRLTNAFGVALIVALPEGDECAALRFVLEGAVVPVPGFGASDCRVCPAHLVQVDVSLDAMAAGDWPVRLARAAGAAGAIIWRSPPVACFWSPPA